MPESIPLFDDPDDWRQQPLVAGAAFIASAAFVALGQRRPRALGGERAPDQPLKRSSATVYLAMFANLMRWLYGHGKTLFTLTADDLQRFLDQGEEVDGVFVQRLNSAIRLRYLRLVERILLHLQVTPNAAQHACFALYRQRGTRAVGRDAPKAVLDETEQQAFLQALPAIPAPTARNAATRWKRRRDRAMQALMLGAGLRVSEVLALRINQVGQPDANGSVPIALDTGAANQVTRPHRTHLRPFAVPDVMDWLAQRLDERDGGKLLFPAAPGSHALLDAATVYRQVKKTFRRAGLDPQRWGGRTLRNSFAVRELEQTGSTELVGELMGHRLQRSTEYYQEALVRLRRRAARTT
jgi:integrase